MVRSLVVNKTFSKHYDVSFLNDDFPTFSQTLLKKVQSLKIALCNTVECQWFNVK